MTESAVKQLCEMAGKMARVAVPLEGVKGPGL